MGTEKKAEKAEITPRNQGGESGDDVRGKRREVMGEVVSSAMNKTIAVKVLRLVRHPKYSKYVRRSSVFKAHDERNEAQVGDKVSIQSSRPYSKTKRWKLCAVIERARVRKEV